MLGQGAGAAPVTAREFSSRRGRRAPFSAPEDAGRRSSFPGTGPPPPPFSMGCAIEGDDGGDDDGVVPGFWFHFRCLKWVGREMGSL